MNDVVQFPNKILSTPTVEVTDFSAITSLAERMFAVMIENEGIGLAANQIYDSRRVAVMQVPGWSRMVMVNPRIVRYIGKSSSKEGCLSVEHSQKRVTVRRAKTIHVEYQDENGLPQKMKAHDLLARCIQHEVDHLDGRICLERAKNSVIYS